MKTTPSLSRLSLYTLATLAASAALLGCGADIPGSRGAAGSASNAVGGSTGAGANFGIAGTTGMGGGSGAGIGGSASGGRPAGIGGSAGTGNAGAAGSLGMSGSEGAGAAGATENSGGSSGVGTSGAAGTGTSGAAGTGTSGAAGSSPTGGAGGSAGSLGCGVVGSPQSGTHRISVNSLEREFNIKLPANYDPSRPYRLIFVWHHLTGTAARVQSSGYSGLESRSAGTAIFVAGQGLDSNGDEEYGWPDSGGRDVAFARALLDWVRTRYCIDNERIFSTGWSYGGMFSNRLGCQMGDVFRAIAPMSGSGPARSGCVGQVAAWIAHGDQDGTVSVNQGQGSRDHWVSSNHCTMTTMPIEPSPCVAYQGCDAGHPVHWCVFSGGHSPASFGSSAIWSFFSQF